MRFSSLAVAALAVAPIAKAQSRYEARVLPSLGGDTAKALAVSNTGVVVGDATRTGQTYPIVAAWIDGQALDLGGSGFSIAGGRGVTDEGLVIGLHDHFGARAIYAVPPEYPPMEIPELATTLSQALAVNAGGEIVGSYTTSTRPYVLRAGVLTQLPLIGGIQGVAQAISNTGIIVGWTSRDSNGGQVAVRWINDQPVQLVGGASVNVAYGVNDQGWIVGYVSGAPFTTYEASLWTSPTARTNLGALAGAWNNIAYGVNNAGQIVGASGGRGFIWQDGQIHDLNDLVVPSTWPSAGWAVTDARAISAGGLVAAQATQGARSYGLLLVPVCSADFNHDGDTGTDADIEAFFACLAGNCCAACGSADFNGDGDVGTDADIEAFFRVLGGGGC
jgi:probable HAF family extracellular repeat protein